jgi:hypothetical protein
MIATPLIQLKIILLIIYHPLYLRIYKSPFIDFSITIRNFIISKSPMPFSSIALKSVL